MDTAQELGLSTAEADDKRDIIEPLSDVLNELDFATTLRRLTAFPALLKSRGVTSVDEEKIKESVNVFLAGDESIDLEPWYDSQSINQYFRQPKEDKARTWLLTYAKRTAKEGRDGERCRGR